MTLEKAKQSAPPLTMAGEYQFIIGVPGDCRLITGIYGPPATLLHLNDEMVLSQRTFVPTDYANDHQGAWLDTPIEE